MTFTCHGYLFIVAQLPFSFELVLNLTNIWYYQLMYLYDTLTQCFDLYFVICCPSMNHCFIVVPGAMLLGGFCPLIGSPMANWSWVTDQTKSDSEDPYDKTIEGTVHPDQDRVSGAPLWSQALGGCPRESVWWPDLSPWGLARHSPKKGKGPIFLQVHHP